MAQPVRKKNGTYQKPRSKTVRKRRTTVSEIIRKNIERNKKPHPEYGTSKLEDRFARNFLERLGIRYERQYYAESVKRYYDFFLPDYNVLIECDGDYYHGYGVAYEEMSPMQKRNRRVDEIKNAWAGEHGIVLIRIWEHDINEHPGKVMRFLRERLSIAGERKIIKENKKKRH